MSADTARRRSGAPPAAGLAAPRRPDDPVFALTVTNAEGNERSLHPTRDAAHAALHDYLVREDCYHSPTRLDADCSAYEVLNLRHRRPRVVAVAIIAAIR